MSRKNACWHKIKEVFVFQPVSGYHAIRSSGYSKTNRAVLSDVIGDFQLLHFV